MIKFRKVLSKHNLPTRMPWEQTLLIFMALQMFAAPIWMWWASGALFLIKWLNYFFEFLTEKWTRLWVDDNKLRHIGWREKVNTAMKVSFKKKTNA